MLNLLQALLKMLPAAKLLRCIITPILRSVFLPACVFVSSVIVIFISVKNDAATATVQRDEKRTGEEQRGRAEKKSRQEEARTLLK